MATSVERTIAVIWRLLWRLAIIAGSIYILYRVRTILISVLIAVLLTYALLPVVEWICRKRIKYLHPKTQRLLATMAVFIGFLALVGASCALMVNPFTREMEKFTKNQATYMTQLEQTVDHAKKWYTKAVPADLKDLVGNPDVKDKISAWATNIAHHALDYTTSWLHFALELILIPVLAFYFVLDYRTISREFYGLVPKERLREALKIGRDTGEILQSYIVGQFILCVIAGIVTGVFLAAMNMPYVVVLAIFAAITRAIPVIGPAVSGIPIIAVGLLNSDGMAVPLYLLTFVVILHFAESKFIMPRLIGYRMHLHPAVVIIVLLVGAEFFGLIGMFLAAPVAAIIRELIQLYYVNPRKRAQKAPRVRRSPKSLVETHSA